jgi:glycosyltransferase involved in cell wall biosynthesis
MKVLFVTREYPPFEVGGVATHTFYLVKNLTELGVSCKVLSFGDSSCSSDGVMFVEPSSSIISRSNSPLARDVRIPVDIMHLTKVANNLIKNEKIDIVHVEEPYVGAFVRHKRKVTTVHDTSYGEIKSILRHHRGFPNFKRAAFYGSLGSYLELMCIASSRAVVVPSLQVRRELLRVYRIPKEKIRVIRNGVEIPELPTSADKAEAKQRLGLSPEKLLIFTAAQHIARKRLDILVEAIRLLRKEKVEGYRVVIAGDGPLRPYIVNLVERCGLERVIELPGWVSQKQLSLYYQATDIFVLTSEYEAGPISLLEAMSFGAAVVSSRIDGFARLMRDGVDGLLFPVGDYCALSDCIKRLLNDASLRMRMLTSARLFAERFDWKSVAEDTKNLYESLF